MRNEKKGSHLLNVRYTKTEIEHTKKVLLKHLRQECQTHEYHRATLHSETMSRAIEKFKNYNKNK